MLRVPEAIVPEVLRRLVAAQLAMLLESLDWCTPTPSWTPRSPYSPVPRRVGVWDDSGVTPRIDSALSEEPATLTAMIAALRRELTEERTARRAAELGLQAKTL